MQTPFPFKLCIVMGAVFGRIPITLFVIINALTASNYFPEYSWKSGSPESQGMNSCAFSSLNEAVEKNRYQLHSIIVIKNGVNIYSCDYYPFSQNGKHDIYSSTKSITSLLFGALADNSISSNNGLVINYLNSGGCRDRRKHEITIIDLLQMRSGLDWNDWESGFKNESIMYGKKNWIDYILSVPMKTSPGIEFAYCGANYHLLSAIICNIIDNDFHSLLADKVLFGQMGVRDYVWKSDPEKIGVGYGHLRMTPFDMSKIGYLCLNEGVWNGKQLIPKEYIWKMWNDKIKVPNKERFYGYGWWSIDTNCYFSWGAGGQIIFIHPQRKLVVVMTGFFDDDNTPIELIKKYILDEGVTSSRDVPLRNSPKAPISLNDGLFEKTYRNAACEDAINMKMIRFQRHNDIHVLSFEFKGSYFNMTFNKTNAIAVGFGTQFVLNRMNATKSYGARGNWEGGNLHVQIVDLARGDKELFVFTVDASKNQVSQVKQMVTLFSKQTFDYAGSY